MPVRRRTLFSRPFAALCIIGATAVGLCCLNGCDDLAHLWTKAPAPQGIPEAKAQPEVAGKSLPSSTLKLQLKVGDRFPLLKSVVQSLIQPSPNGEQRSSSELELLLTIDVAEQPRSGAHAGETRLGVTYHRVRYKRDVGDEHILYDSDTDQGTVPIAALGYQALVGQGFSFWLGADNQIRELVGFDEFLKACVSRVDPMLQADVWTALTSQSGADGIANFVDDSIGLLPGKSVKIGDTWTVKRRTDQPIGMQITTNYKLQDVSETQAEISLQGSIAPAASLAAGLQNQNALAHVTVQKGRSSGGCTLDLRTGLPLHSQVEQNLSMHVQLGSGEEFTQHKQTITTIRAFPNESHAGSPATGSPTGKTPAPVANRRTRTTVPRTATRPSATQH